MGFKHIWVSELLCCCRKVIKYIKDKGLNIRIAGLNTAWASTNFSIDSDDTQSIQAEFSANEALIIRTKYYDREREELNRYLKEIYNKINRSKR